jgi:hypothetical protein
MYHIASINANKFEDFENSIWIDREKVFTFIDLIETKDLQTTINNFFNPDSTKNNYDLNTVDCLYTRTHIYQIIYECGSEQSDNYVASILSYKRKPITGNILLVKNKVHNSDNKITYAEDDLTIDDIKNIIYDLFYHKGCHIKNTITEIQYDNKYKMSDNDRLLNMEFRDINLFNIPFRIYYSVTENNEIINTSYLQDLGIFLDKKITEAYIVTKIYPQCKSLSLDIDMVKKFINIVSNITEEEELKEIVRAYHFANKDLQTENMYILFDEFYWKLKESF